ncbi:MAG: hypothetical protein B6241_08845 [Spirochaetaceae bacterium 4572_59]|nr:MAG: hypothetical protein B6241_08845 [Spirochaetaceae bacterium 4572_59]
MLGRFQNPWLECNPSELKETHLLRRQSGGGTVYHDLGNLNFSFIGEEKDFDKTENLKLICQTLTKTGVFLDINDRHDLVIKHKDEVYKVSGSAFRHKRGRVFHHGTLLIQTDKEKLKQALQQDKNRNIIKAGGTASFRSKVINLTEIYKDLSLKTVLKQFEQSYNKEGSLNWEELRTSEQVQNEVRLLTSEKWLLDKTPLFKQDISRAFPEGKEKQIIAIKKGFIADVPEELLFLKGIPYGREETATILKKRIEAFSGSIKRRNELFSRLLLIIR